MKLCKDCKWFGDMVKGPPLTMPFLAEGCLRPLPGEPSVVTGGPRRHLREWCEDERKPGRVWLFGRERCGPDAKFFEKG